MRTLPFVLLLLACEDSNTQSPSTDGPLAIDAVADGAPDAKPEPDARPDARPLDATVDARVPINGARAWARPAREGELPEWPSKLQTWAAGDFILANDRVAIVIEEAGTSDLYDPYGGKPLGVARIEDGALVEPMDFGELLLLTGRMTVMPERVTVLSDGSDGRAAVVRAEGPIRPVPFFTSITAPVFPQDFAVFGGALEYVLEPGAEYVDIYYVYENDQPMAVPVQATMHGFMYTPRVKNWSPMAGFAGGGISLSSLAFVDDRATSLAYLPREGEVLRPGISASGYRSNFTGFFVIEADTQTRIHHARLLIAGRGLDGVVAALARLEGRELRSLTGVVRDASGAPAPGVRVHALGEDGLHLTRTLTDEEGRYALHVPEAPVTLTTWRRGDTVVGPVEVPADASEQDLTLNPGGWVSVTATEEGVGAVPVRVSVFPTGEAELPQLPELFGESGITGGRLHIDFPHDGRSRLRVPAGEWQVVVSRGFEYDLHSEVVSVMEGAEVEVEATLRRVVQSPGVMCADFHIHTHRSNDSGDDARLKLRSAAADGLEIPARSDHEYVEPWDDLVLELGLGAHMYGMSSVEMTTFEVYGHFGVIPTEVGPGPNGGTPLWQQYPTLEAPDTPVEDLLPPALFEQVRLRPEGPKIIVNHPRGRSNYFDAAGYDPATGEVERPEMWDDEFRLVEFFKNANHWQSNLGGLVADWLGFLNRGRKVFAVGSSDSHSIWSSPVGYPRTCITLGTDDPRAIDGATVRDAVYEGHATISGGVFMEARVGEAGPGDEARGVGETATLHLRIQAPLWMDVDAFDLVVDGVLVSSTPILAEHASAENPVIRYEDDIQIEVAEGGSYVIAAAYGDAAMEPVHRGKKPFGVTNPIFLSR